MPPIELVATRASVLALLGRGALTLLGFAMFGALVWALALPRAVHILHHGIHASGFPQPLLQVPGLFCVLLLSPLYFVCAAILFVVHPGFPAIVRVAVAGRSLTWKPLLRRTRQGEVVWFDFNEWAKEPVLRIGVCYNGRERTLRIESTIFPVGGLRRLASELAHSGKVSDEELSPCSKCRTCGYNLTGNVSGTCPECGRNVYRRA